MQEVYNSRRQEAIKDGVRRAQEKARDELFDPNVAKDEAFLTYAVSILTNAENN